MAAGPLADPEGLCARCAEARQVPSRRGPAYTLCGLSHRDERFPRYPRLPVLRCAGFTPATPHPESPPGA